MTHMKMQSGGDELDIHLEVNSDGAVETAFNSHLFKDALVNLIEEAPVDFWMKDDGELKPEEFWASMLGAVARSYRAHDDASLNENVTNAQVLRDLIDWLEREEYI